LSAFAYKGDSLWGITDNIYPAVDNDRGHFRYYFRIVSLKDVLNSSGTDMLTCTDKISNPLASTDTRIVSGLFIYENAPSTICFIEQYESADANVGQVMTMCVVDLIPGRGLKRCGKINFNVDFSFASNNYFTRATAIYSPHDWNSNE
jgi:hypothetical protein